MKENSETKHRGKKKRRDKRTKESRNNEKKIKLKQEKKKMDKYRQKLINVNECRCIGECMNVLNYPCA